MDPRILDAVGKLDADELIKLRDVVDRLIKKSFGDNLGKRGGKRVAIRIAATCQIEREKQFFDREIKVTIIEMSGNGLLFKTGETLLVDDLVEIYFRSPSNGVKKKIDCKILRVAEVSDAGAGEYHIAAKAVTKEEVRQYKEWLSKRFT